MPNALHLILLSGIIPRSAQGTLYSTGVMGVELGLALCQTTALSPVLLSLRSWLLLYFDMYPLFYVECCSLLLVIRPLTASISKDILMTSHLFLLTPQDRTSGRSQQGPSLLSAWPGPGSEIKALCRGFMFVNTTIYLQSSWLRLFPLSNICTT